MFFGTIIKFDQYAFICNYRSKSWNNFIVYTPVLKYWNDISGIAKPNAFLKILKTCLYAMVLINNYCIY